MHLQNSRFYNYNSVSFPIQAIHGPSSNTCIVTSKTESLGSNSNTCICIVTSTSKTESLGLRCDAMHSSHLQYFLR